MLSFEAAVVTPAPITNTTRATKLIATGFAKGNHPNENHDRF
jgi:hypothetical protein